MNSTPDESDNTFRDVYEEEGIGCNTALLEEPEALPRDYEHRVLGLLECLYDVAFTLTHNADAASEIVQMTVVKALRNQEQYEGGRLKSQLLSLLRETYQDEYASTGEEPSVLVFPGSDELFGHAPYTARQGTLSPLLGLMDEQTQQAIKSLPDEFRRAVIMADVESMTYKEIAAAMNCPLGTVRSRLFRGRRLLQERLD